MQKKKTIKLSEELLDDAFSEQDGLYYESPEDQQLRLQRDERNRNRNQKLYEVAKRELPSRQFEALALKHGLGDAIEPRTDREVGIVMGVSHVRARDLYKKAIAKLQPFWKEVDNGSEI